MTWHAKLSRSMKRRSGAVWAAAALLAVCLAALLAYRNSRPASSGKAGPATNPEILHSRPMQPVDRPAQTGTRYPVDEEWVRPLPPPSFAQGNAARESQHTPEQLNPPNVVPTSPGPHVYKLPASPTQAHSLDEAARVMGYGPEYQGIIGVTRTHPLPAEAQTKVLPTDVRSVTVPLSSAPSVVGAPPGVNPDEVGKTKTQPLPADGKPPE